MKEYKFSPIFNPDNDPDFPKYKKHLYSLLYIIDPLLINKIVDDEDTLNELHSMFATFAMYVYQEGLKGRIDN